MKNKDGAYVCAMGEMRWFEHPSGNMFGLRDGPDPNLDHRAGVSVNGFEKEDGYTWTAFPKDTAHKRDYKNCIDGFASSRAEAMRQAYDAVLKLDSPTGATVAEETKSLSPDVSLAIELERVKHERDTLRRALKWIRVEEKLPLGGYFVDLCVLIEWKDGTGQQVFRRGYYDHGMWDYSEIKTDKKYTARVTHWKEQCPLPSWE